MESLGQDAGPRSQIVEILIAFEFEKYLLRIKVVPVARIVREVEVLCIGKLHLFFGVGDG